MAHDWNRSILIATVGTAPGVVTETVWALLDRKPEAWVPTAIYLVTTTLGRQECQKALLGSTSQLAALFRAKGLEPFEPIFIVPQVNSSQPIEDIRTKDENVAFANEITRLVQSYAQDQNSRIHVSIAGGRKTMSSYAQAALSIFGRDQDELTHVLISIPEFEYSPRFFYPEQEQQDVPIKVKDQKSGMLLDDVRKAREARIELVPSPFVRLGYILKEDAFPKGVVDYERIIQQVQAGLEEDRIKLICQDNELVVGRSVRIPLPARVFAFYRVLAQARKELWPGAGPDGFGNDHQGWLTYGLMTKALTNGRRPLDLFCDFYKESAAISEKNDAFNDKAIGAKLSTDELIGFAANNDLTKVLKRFKAIKSSTGAEIETNIFNIKKRELADIREISERSAKRGGGPNSEIARFGLLLEPSQIVIEV